MATTIDSLQIEIQSNSTSAASGIRDLATSLESLKKIGSINTVVKNLNNLSAAIKGFGKSDGAATSLEKLAHSLEAIRNVGSISKVGTNLAKLASSLKAVDGINIDGVAPKIQSIASAVEPLSKVKSGGIGSMMTGLKKIKEVTATLDDTTIRNFAERVRLLSNELTPLSQKMTTVATGFKAINSKTRSVSSGFKSLNRDINTTTLNLSSLITVVQTAVHWLTLIAKALTNVIGEAIEWDGIHYQFGNAFGSQADEYYKKIVEISDVMDINKQTFMETSAMATSMLTGFGVGAKDAREMGVGYTELAYDIWAAYNNVYKSLDGADGAMAAVRSAIAGEVEPIRRAGFTIVDSQLAITAANHGLAYSTQGATEAQKSYLRYLTLVDQASKKGIIGAYASEMNTAEGTIRTFRQQLNALSQAFGSLFLPALVKVVPWLTAIVELLTEAIHKMAGFFGIDIQKVDFSGFTDIGSIADNATESMDGTGEAIDDTKQKLKELKNATLGFDELNIISPPTQNPAADGNGGAGGAGAGGYTDIPISSIWDQALLDSVKTQVDDIKNMIKDSLGEITAVVSGFLLAIGTILVVTGVNIPLGLGLMAAGAVGLAATVAVNWNSMNEKLAKTLTTITATLGGFLLGIGAVLAFTGANIPLGIGLMAAGAVSLATAVAINWHALDGDLKNALSIAGAAVGGSLLGIGAILAFTGVAMPLGIAMMAVGAAGIATAAALNWESLSKKVKGVISDIGGAVGGGLLALGAVFAFTGVNIPLGIALMAAGAVTLASTVALDWNSLKGNVSNTVKKIGAVVGGALIAVGALLAFTGVALPLGIGLMAAGAVSLGSSVALNWDSIRQKVKSVVEGIKQVIMKYGKPALGVLLVLSGVGVAPGLWLLKDWLTETNGSGQTNWDSMKTKITTSLSSAWSAAQKWWNSKPALKEISAKVGSIKDKVSSAWNAAKTWWSNKKGSLSTYAPSIGSIKSKLSSAWSTAKTWWNKSKGSMSYTPTIGSIKSKLQSAWNTAKTWWNKNVKLSIPSLKLTVSYSEPSSKILKAAMKALNLPGIPKLKFAANGGIFDQGSLIWAGERGPEVMATAAGGRTGVMNIDQMQEAVYQGVYAALMATRGSSDGDNGNVNVYLDGKLISRSVEKAQRERGSSIMGKEVFAY